MHRVASLFSGAGGMDLGFVSVSAPLGQGDLAGGFEIAFAVEASEPPARTYAGNFGLSVHRGEGPLPAVVLGGVEGLDFSRLGAEAVDLLVGGPPCQDFSTLRGPKWERRGIETHRGKLYRHFVRALLQLRPKAFLFENVKGLVSANGGVAYRTILEEFEAAGWRVVFSGVLNAKDFGVPQARERLFILGVRKDLVKGPLGRIRKAFAQSLRERSRSFPQYPLTPLEAFEGQPLPALEERYREVMAEYEDLLGRKRWSVLDDYLEVNSAPKEGADHAFEEHEEVLRELGFLGKRVLDLEVKDGTTFLPKEAPHVLERMRRIPPGANHEAVRGRSGRSRGGGSAWSTAGCIL